MLHIKIKDVTLYQIIRTMKVYEVEVSQGLRVKSNKSINNQPDAVRQVASHTAYYMGFLNKGETVTITIWLEGKILTTTSVYGKD